ncbi:hypothetical protein R1flu_012625 [Riccia fluitans]|uniref:Uncharacterized protein n=1 Tax=Riccia fluitans TaxID=41844 RepID=A0ABD1ZBE0_9MARC
MGHSLQAKVATVSNFSSFHSLLRILALKILGNGILEMIFTTSSSGRWTTSLASSASLAAAAGSMVLSLLTLTPPPPPPPPHPQSAALSTSNMEFESNVAMEKKVKCNR